MFESIIHSYPDSFYRIFEVIISYSVKNSPLAHKLNLQICWDMKTKIRIQFLKYVMLEWGLSHHLSVGMAIDRPEICTYRKMIDTWMIKIPLFLNIN